MKFETIILDKPGVTDFAKERNVLLSKAKSDWILFLDTDEKLSEGLKKEIEILNPKDFKGFYIKRKIYFLGKTVGKDNVLRLAKKDAGKWKRKVHETWDVKGKVGELNGFIIHSTGEKLTDYISKMNYYSDIHARENRAEGKKSNIFKIIFYPMAKFMQNIFFGRGVIFSFIQALHSFLSWTKLWELQNK